MAAAEASVRAVAHSGHEIYQLCLLVNETGVFPGVFQYEELVVVLLLEAVVEYWMPQE